MEVIANEGDFQIIINEKKISLPARLRQGLVYGDVFIVVLDVN